MPPIRIVGSALGLGLAATTAAAASHPVVYRTGPDQPFCTSELAMLEFPQAITDHDRTWIDSLTSCRFLPAGLAVLILKRNALDPGAAPVARVRVRRGGRWSAGFMTEKGLSP